MAKTLQLVGIRAHKMIRVKILVQDLDLEMMKHKMTLLVVLIQMILEIIQILLAVLIQILEITRIQIKLEDKAREATHRTLPILIIKEIIHR